MLQKIILLFVCTLCAPLLFAAPALAAQNGAQPQASANWAGYVADTAASYTAVGGSWSIPTPAVGENLATDATWVGIGGVKSDDLIQAGTQAVLEGGQTEYQAWYELLPGYQHLIPLAVRGGDSVTVSLAQTSPGQWHLSFKDNTTGGDYEKNLAYQSSLSSAEWIEEMPVAAEGPFATYLPLDNFGTVTFSGGYTVVGGQGESIAASSAVPLTMESRRQALATPSNLLADDSFSISRSATSLQSSAPTAYATYSRRSFRAHSRQYVIVISF